MQTILSILSSVFWGLITLSALVFVHEGGHFLAARACGVRVTEFFLGLPCSKNVHVTSKRIGTKFGITPLLLGGYAAICGMDPTGAPCAPAVLSALHRHGRVSVRELAQELSLAEDDVQGACAVLEGWASIVPVYENEDGSPADRRYYATVYSAPARDKQGFTVYDGCRFDAASATNEGEPWMPQMGEQAFYEHERSRTYIGQNFPKRAFMLLAGIFVNIVCGMLLLMSVYSVIGVKTVVNTNAIATVERGGVAYEAGVRDGDRILRIGDDACKTWQDITVAVANNADGHAHKLVYKHKGKTRTGTIRLKKNQLLGINAKQETLRLGVADSLRVSVGYVKSTAEGVMKLLMPEHTKEVLDSSTSVVGISVMSSQAASYGVSTYLSFAALISLSLGFMNLLPIPPLDGGKLLIEVIQLGLRRDLSYRAQAIVSCVGIALFALLFVYMLRSDILRFIL